MLVFRLNHCLLVLKVVKASVQQPTKQILTCDDRHIATEFSLRPLEVWAIYLLKRESIPIEVVGQLLLVPHLLCLRHEWEGGLMH